MKAKAHRVMTWKFERWHVVHVVPVGDVRVHVAAATVDCWCRPVAQDWTSGTVHHHRAADRRPGYGLEGDEAGSWRVSAWTEHEAGRYRGRKGARP